MAPKVWMHKPDIPGLFVVRAFLFQDLPSSPTCLHLPRHSLSTGASREAPVDKRAHQDCNKTRAVSTDTNRKCMKTLFGVHAQVSYFFMDLGIQVSSFQGIRILELRVLRA